MDVTQRIAGAHDLIAFSAAEYDGRLPDWVHRRGETAWAVVRRVQARPGHTSAGLRGRLRSERQAIEVDDRLIQRLITPEQLSSLRLESTTNPRLCLTLEVLAVGAASWFGDRAWGPTGSVGFQLATGIDVVRDTSDLDLLVRAPERLDRNEARAISAELHRLPSRVDCLLETNAGAVALAEWAAASPGDDVLLRTPSGAQLTRDPWSLSTITVRAR